MNKKIIEKIDWKKGDGLIPAVVQDNSSGTVLMLGYVNKESLEKSIESGEVWFWSRSKGRLWKKGETSGNVLKLVDIKVDCDFDALLIKANPTGATCHLGRNSCFDYEFAPDRLRKLFSVIEGRKKEMPEKSYTADLFRAGADKITLKVSEESMEVIQAAQKETPERLVEETVDLIFHLFVLLAEKKISLFEVEAEIEKRMRQHGNG
ncbi:MAG TPA: bifunctional phosphoribosyl-AMP cyclohydrolase/phosphoribosyl-ATP diphosphatase HisIE [Candidatus Paceibacterota bacterium]